MNSKQNRSSLECLWHHRANPNALSLTALSLTALSLTALRLHALRLHTSLKITPIAMSFAVSLLIGCNVSQPQPNNNDARVEETSAPCANFQLGLYADPQGEVQLSLRRSIDANNRLQILVAELGQELNVDSGPQSFVDTLTGKPQLQAQARCDGRALRIQGQRSPRAGSTDLQNLDYTIEIAGSDLAITSLVGSRLRSTVVRLVPSGGTTVADLHALVASSHRADRCPSFARRAQTFVGTTSTGRAIQFKLFTPARKVPTLQIGNDTLPLDGIARTQQGVTRLALCDANGDLAFLQLGRVAEPMSAKFQVKPTHLRGQLRVKSSRWTTEESFLLAPQ